MITFRIATKKDVPFIVEMLADDKLGALREKYENPLPQLYYDAFEEINADKNQELVVVEDINQEIIGTLQLSFIPYLTYQGGVRAQIEAVRIRKEQRGKGYGELLFKWAIERAKERDAHVLQLTTDKKRPEAIKFLSEIGIQSFS